MMTLLLTSTGWMHHAVEQFGGHGTRDSFPPDGLNRGPWPPVGSRTWQTPARSVAMTTNIQTLTSLFDELNPTCSTYSRSLKGCLNESYTPTTHKLLWKLLKNII